MELSDSSIKYIRSTIIFIAILIIIGGLLYVNSGVFHNKVAKVKGYASRCIDGVKYLEFTNGATVKYNKNGQVELCN